MPTIAVAAIVFDAGGRVLLIQRGKPPGEGLWSLPGGRLEHNERISDGVAREVREETGLLVEVGPLVEIVERISDTHHYVILDYVCRATGGELRAGDDARDVRWADTLDGLSTTSGLADVIDRARAIRPPWST